MVLWSEPAAAVGISWLALAAVVLLAVVIGQSVIIVVLLKPKVPPPMVWEETMFWTSHEGRKIHAERDCTHLANSSKVKSWTPCMDCSRGYLFRTSHAKTR